MERRCCQWAIIALVFMIGTSVVAQKKTNLVYVDKSGVLRYTSGNAEAAFFGVNYIAPFAYPYRAIRSLHIDLEEEIRQDVYHFARLGLDAFRVHLWDTELSDTLGNLLENEHLRLFDFLLYELKKRNIKTIITPIAFWGNGFPEKDQLTPGFSRKYGKAGATINDTAILAQENYLRQLFTHVNPYTKVTYGNDPDVIAVELNNEPIHSGPKAGVTNYINRLAAAVKSTGWKKPVFYNISLSFNNADAVAKANLDGFSFHWYATGGLSNHEVRGNYLPNVDRYDIPYDSLPGYRNKAKMVYEFDTPDMLASYMYPVMAKSFRAAGFQWATQFAYDPMGIAYANVEHQTHYLNLAYTPSKAISFLIASRVFHKLPRLKSFGSYYANYSFDVFRVNYKELLSEMNSGEEFYYSNSTGSKPLDINKLQHLAGVGNSQVVQYSGLGAYFLDKMGKGVWRLEVMPDAIHIRNPFENPSLQKEMTRIGWRKQSMGISLPDIGQGFEIKGLNKGNDMRDTVTGNTFSITPGTYLLTAAGANAKFDDETRIGVIGLNEFVAPLPFSNELFVKHTPLTEVPSGKPFNIQAQVVGVEPGDTVVAMVNRVGVEIDQSTIIPMKNISAYCYSAEIPVTLTAPGALEYRIIIKTAGDGYHVFPGNYKGHPLDWDYIHEDTWQTFVADEKSDLEIYNPTTDRDSRTYPSLHNSDLQRDYIAGPGAKKLVLKLGMREKTDHHFIGFQFFFADNFLGRRSETFNKLVIRARTADPKPVNGKITLITTEAISWSAQVTLTNNFMDIEIPLNTLKRDSMLVLPVSTPEFMPLWFTGSELAPAFNINDTEKVQVTIGTDITLPGIRKPYSLELESIKLRK